ncbi:efflux RND transporter periplasmic adaptor subunit [Candidatus Pantoea deserta]|uniref:Efflux RND transporter periplasmic adaptor subunit n=1 Tax=Candidatus Pantoea deserta TaxID=1869313 RepID=A0A3N4NK74_9GAMM|nr:efflux RND transporter periplasmic adaptor subunit [Pantoea deserta]RPD95905.1 efflux RND transporter periplasmic adaptor subunit [Pantoea deserta]
MKTKFSLLCLCVLLSGCDHKESDAQSSQPNAKVDVVTIKTHSVNMFSDLPGRTVAVRTAEVRPQVSGIILKRYFDEGSEVKEGQQLYQIDDSSYASAVEKAKAQYINAKNELARDQQLIKADAVSKQVLDNATSTFLQAKADLRSAEVNLNYTRVRAPISGRIGRSSVTEGALVSAEQSNALSTITQTDPIYVDVNEPYNELLRLRSAVSSGKVRTPSSHEAAVQLILDNGTAYPLQGTLEFSEVRVDEGTGSVLLRARFPNPKGELLPGMFVHTRFSQGVDENGITVPQQSILRDNKGAPYVLTVDANNKVQERQVTTGQMNNGQWQILSGLKAGERVMVNGMQNTAPGAAVDVTEAKQPAAATQPSISLSMTDPSAQ